MADSDVEYDSGGSDGYDDSNGDDYYSGGSDNQEDDYYESSDANEGGNYEDSDDDFSPSGGGNGEGYAGSNQYNSQMEPKYYGGSSKAVAAPQKSYNYQQSTRNNIVNKQTGGYVRTTVKESSSSGDVFKERSTGRVGYKDEYKTTSTVKVGDKRGYSEYQKEERFRRVDYGNSSSRSSYSSNKYLK